MRTTPGVYLLCEILHPAASADTLLTSLTFDLLTMLPAILRVLVVDNCPHLKLSHSLHTTGLYHNWLLEGKRDILKTTKLWLSVALYWQFSCNSFHCTHLGITLDASLRFLLRAEACSLELLLLNFSNLSKCVVTNSHSWDSDRFLLLRTTSELLVITYLAVPWFHPATSLVMLYKFIKTTCVLFKVTFGRDFFNELCDIMVTA